MIYFLINAETLEVWRFIIELAVFCAVGYYAWVAKQQRDEARAARRERAEEPDGGHARLSGA